MTTLQIKFDSTGWDQEEGRTCHKTLMLYVKRLAVCSLDYVYRDCAAAVKAMPEGHKAGHYTDTMHYIGMRKAQLKQR